MTLFAISRWKLADHSCTCGNCRSGSMTLIEPVLKAGGWRSAAGVWVGVSAAMTGPTLRKSPPDWPKAEFDGPVVLPGVLWKIEEPKRKVAMRSEAMR